MIDHDQRQQQQRPDTGNKKHVIIVIDLFLNASLVYERKLKKQLPGHHAKLKLPIVPDRDQVLNKRCKLVQRYCRNNDTQQHCKQLKRLGLN